MPGSGILRTALSQRGHSGIMARLLAEDWNEMTAKARASDKHVSSLDRWISKACVGRDLRAADAAVHAVLCSPDALPDLPDP
jgi:hypothetical protein